jgi:hypothetical protein
VSDQFAGRTGPCPKCKKSITIPAAPAQAVVIHEPEAPVVAPQSGGRMPTAPISSSEKPPSRWNLAAIAGGAVAAILAAVIARAIWGPGLAPSWVLGLGAVVLALPCVLVGYGIARERELEPYRDGPLLVRAIICAVVYALLWGVRGFIPAEMTTEMWQWLYIAPLFFGAGALASLATLDLEWAAAVAHYSLYVLFTALLRWAAGFTPI